MVFTRRFGLPICSDLIASCFVSLFQALVQWGTIAGKSGRATSGRKKREKEKRRKQKKRKGEGPLFYQTPLVARPLFRSSPLTESPEQATVFGEGVLYVFIDLLRFSSYEVTSIRSAAHIGSCSLHKMINTIVSLELCQSAWEYRSAWRTLYDCLSTTTVRCLLISSVIRPIFHECAKRI